MACSEARLLANRANARRSTGPRTEEGKESSRRNALRHGLTAEVVAPAEDAAELSRLSAALVVELAPEGTPAGRLLAERVATLSVRLKRSARHEAAATTERLRMAALDFDMVREEEAERLFAAIAEGTNRDDLLTMPEGVDLMVAALIELGAAVEGKRWTPEDSGRLVPLLPAEVRDHAAALGRAILDGDLSGLDAGLVAIMDRDNVRGPWAFDQLAGLIGAEREFLADHRPTLDHAGIARLRVEAVNLVLVDGAPETLLARKYEAATERALFRALKEIRELRKAPGAAPAPPDPAAELARRAEEARRQYARVEGRPAPPPAPALGSILPATAGRPAPAHASAPAHENAAPRGRSRYDDRRRRPKLGR